MNSSPIRAAALAAALAVFAVACGGSSGDEADDGRPVLAEPTGGDPQGIPGQTSGGLPFPAGGALVLTRCLLLGRTRPAP